jgi:hypothetical protein
MTPPDEIWTTSTGQKIAVGDMSESHVRNVLRMILRNRRREAAKLISTQHDDDFAFSVGEMQDQLDAEARDHTGMLFNTEYRFWYYPADRKI